MILHTYYEILPKFSSHWGYIFVMLFVSLPMALNMKKYFFAESSDSYSHSN